MLKFKLFQVMRSPAFFSALLITAAGLQIILNVQPTGF
jgi:hypothetical protein